MQAGARPRVALEKPEGDGKRERAEKDLAHREGFEDSCWSKEPRAAAVARGQVGQRLRTARRKGRDGAQQRGELMRRRDGSKRHQAPV